MKKLTFGITISLLLSACGGDGINDIGYEEAMTREAMCVIASERFQLYAEAEEHSAHGIRFSQLQFEKINVQSSFPQQVASVKSMASGFNKDFSARYLKERCNRSISNMEYQRG